MSTVSSSPTKKSKRNQSNNEKGRANRLNKGLWRDFLITLLFNTIVGTFIALLRSGDLIEELYFSLIYAQSIGLSCIFFSYTLMWLRRLERPDVLSFLIGLPLGLVIGFNIALLIIGKSFTEVLYFHPDSLLIALGATLTFGTAICYYFYSKHALAETKAALQAETLHRVNQDKHLVEANLKLLQAQIEPHFLFNTLANVISLIETNPQCAKTMLERFTHYLRASLQCARQEQTTLEDELELIRTYLEIHVLRMDDRLKYTIDSPDSLRYLVLPPLLLQPVVENAVKHGLEPKVEGGTIQIQVNTSQTHLILSVTDNGQGFQQESSAGLGLRNIRERLQALYGNEGQLLIRENQPCGIRCQLIVPLDLMHADVDY